MNAGPGGRVGPWRDGAWPEGPETEDREGGPSPGSALDAAADASSVDPPSSPPDLGLRWTGPTDLGVGDTEAMNGPFERTLEYAGSRPGCPDPWGRTSSRASAVGPRVSHSLAPRDAGSETARVAIPNSAPWGAENVRRRPVHHGRKTAPGDSIPLPRIPGSMVLDDSYARCEARGAGPRST